MIVAFEPAYLTEAARVYVRVFTEAPWNDRWTYEDARKRLSDITKTPGFVGFGHLTRAEKLDGFVLGCIEQWYGTKHFCVKEMAVERQWQREGIGSQLLDALHAAAPSLGVSRIELLTARDSPAEAFYAKHGYDVSPRMELLRKDV